MDRPTNELLGRLSFLANTRGIIPNPDNATRIYLSVLAQGVETILVYTVPTGKVLFVNSANLASRESAAAVATCRLFVRDAIDAFVYAILSHMYDLAGHQTSHQTYSPAIGVPAGYDICLVSSHANIDVYGDIFGWLEDA